MEEEKESEESIGKEEEEKERVEREKEREKSAAEMLCCFGVRRTGEGEKSRAAPDAQRTIRELTSDLVLVAPTLCVF